jgi:hypothetical protein
MGLPLGSMTDCSYGGTAPPGDGGLPLGVQGRLPLGLLLPTKSQREINENSTRNSQEANEKLMRSKREVNETPKGRQQEVNETLTRRQEK